MKAAAGFDPKKIVRLRRRRLAQWLKDWGLELAAAAADPAEHACLDKATVVLQEGSEPKPGQIRLMYPDTFITSRRPLYVLVMGQSDGGDWLIAPFGRLSVPALPGEWRTGSRALPAKVLCAWNARLVAARRITRSWIAGTAGKSRIQTAARLISLCFDMPIPGMPCLNGMNTMLPLASLALGPPLEHPLDPRHRYLSEEESRMDDIGVLPGLRRNDFCRRGLLLAVSCGQAFSYDDAARNDLLLAAEQKGDYHSGRK